MTVLEYSLIFLCFFLFVLLCASIYFNVKHGLLILKMTESMEEVLDTLDEKYSSISKVLEIPLFYDSPQVRGVVEDIRECRDVLLKSASKLTNIQQEEDEKEENY